MIQVDVAREQLSLGLLARWTVPGAVDKFPPHAEAHSKISVLMPPSWRRLRLQVVLGWCGAGRTGRLLVAVHIAVGLRQQFVRALLPAAEHGDADTGGDRQCFLAQQIRLRQRMLDLGHYL